MFASGSPRLQTYAVAILTQIGAALNDVENRISIARPHGCRAVHRRPRRLFELGVVVRTRERGAPRASFRAACMPKRLLQVRGLADVLPLNSNVVDEPTNRRISILVMNKAAEQAFSTMAAVRRLTKARRPARRFPQSRRARTLLRARR